MEPKTETSELVFKLSDLKNLLKESSDEAREVKNFLKEKHYDPVSDFYSSEYRMSFMGL